MATAGRRNLAWTQAFRAARTFAFGGARAADNGDSIPDLGAQIGAFLASGLTLGTNPLAVIWVGGNDFRDLPDMPTPDDITATITNVVTAIGDGITALYAEGIRTLPFSAFPISAPCPNMKAIPSGQRAPAM